MNLLGVQLSGGGIAFMEARCRHRGNSSMVEEVVCETQADVTKANAWLKDHGHDEVARLATDEELKIHKNLVPF